MRCDQAKLWRAENYWMFIRFSGMRTTVQRLAAPSAVALVCGLLAWLGISLTADTGEFSAIWLPNGLVLGFMLADRQNRWKASMVLAAGATIVAAAAAADITHAIVRSLINVLEIGLTFALLRRHIDSPESLFSQRKLARFIGWGVLGAPLLGSAFAAASLLAFDADAVIAAFERRFAAHALGVAMVVPLVIACTRADLRGFLRDGSLRPSIPLLTLALTTIGVFSQDQFPLLFLVWPPFLWVVFRFGYLGAAMGAALIGIIATGATFVNLGAMMLVADGTFVSRMLPLQIFLGTCVLTAYPVCAMLARQRELMSDLSQREQQLRVITENSSDVIIHTDRSGIRTYVSPSMEQVFGYPPAYATGRGGSAAIHKDDRAAFEQEESKLAAGADGTMATYRVRHAHGHFVWVEVNARTMRDASGRVMGWVSVSRDVSARKRIEQLKADFISTISHELRTPLTALNGALGLAQSGKVGEVSPPVARLLALAKSNGERLAALVNDILDFEKLSSGGMEFVCERLSVDQVLERAVAANGHYALRFNVKYELAPQCELEVFADAHRIQQVLANLLSNAAKFSPAGATVRVGARLEQGVCIVFVSDHGRGIPKQFQSRLFDRFSQADASDGRTHAGTGLGLAIAKQMTEGMGGKISFFTKENEGTTFYLHLPLSSTVVPNAA